MVKHTVSLIIIMFFVGFLVGIIFVYAINLNFNLNVDWINRNKITINGETFWIYCGNPFYAKEYYSIIGRFELREENGDFCYVYLGDYSELPEGFFILNEDDSMQVDRCWEDKIED